jgi:bacterioferritin (cytochrome b1)
MSVTRKEEIIAVLNEALQAEIKAVKMYLAHAEAIADPEIAQGLRNIGEVEEGHARALMVCIKALNGQPALDEGIEVLLRDGPRRDPVAVAEMLRSDLDGERWAINHYAAAIAEFFPDGNDETLAVLEENLVDELRHAHWLRDQLRILVQSA